MNNETKEILEDLKEHSHSKYVAPFELIDIECKLLLDYITNLQEENQKLNNKTKRLDSKIKVLEHNCKQAEDSCRQHRLANKNKKRRLQRREEQINLYKTRIDKAIEYINKSEYATIESYKHIHADEDGKVYNLDILLNILKGSDE